MENVIMWIIIGLIAAGLLAFIIYNIVKIAKMSPEDRKKTIITYLKGAIALAEQEIVGTKRGEERLAMVEDYFNKNASWFLKILLALCGKETLKECIELGLTEIKKSFGE